jgi:FKBP-type peptidyl-prolyl cis-trans isomerase SlyD
MEISKNKVVELSYKLHLDSFKGEIVEEVNADSPFVFIFETGEMLEAFEANIKGLKKGDTFKFKVDHKEAYGEVENENIVDLPKNIFEVDGKFNEDFIFVGAQVPMKDEEGNEFDGFIVEISKTKVKVDFNHPLAGEDLYFIGSVINVRTATKEEISHGHVHGHGGFDHN